MKFGQYAILTPVEYTFKNEPDWNWTFKPPTAKHELELQAFIAHGRTITVGGRTETHPITPMEAIVEQLALTFGGTTIPAFEMRDGEWVALDRPVLKADASKSEIKRVLGEMPTDMVYELWDALGENIPNWGPLNKNPKS